MAARLPFGRYIDGTISRPLRALPSNGAYDVSIVV